MERVKITRTIVYTAFVPLTSYHGLPLREIIEYEKSLELADALEVLELIAETDDSMITTATTVELEVTSDR